MELNPVRRFLAGLFEPCFRCGGALGAFFGRDWDGVEMVLRGKVLGGKRNLRIGRGVRLVGPARRFRFGDGVCLYGNSYLNANGPNGFIEIQGGCHVDVSCVLYGQGGLTIEENCAIASGVFIYSQTNADTLKDGTPVCMQPVVYASVRIEGDCWLGTGVRVLPGVTIGKGCHVGAGAVVTDDLGPLSIAVGVPAKVIKKRPQ
jgi:acetyltransferase-like isoleucine patch superfamily enzyme